MENNINKSNKVEVTIEVPAIGNVFFETVFSEIFDHKGKFVIKIPKRKMYFNDYNYIDVTHIVEADIEHFKKLNKISDENHQVIIDTLCLYGIKVSGNYVRLQYWFNQDNDPEIHIMCAGRITHCVKSNKFSFNDDEQILFSDLYSSDVCVFW